MKRKNLEKAIVLGLMLGCVYSTAWAADDYFDDTNDSINYDSYSTPIEADSNTRPVNVNNKLGNLVNDADGYHLNSVKIYGNVIFNNLKSGLSPYSFDGLAFDDDKGNVLIVDNDLDIKITASEGENVKRSMTLNGLYISDNTFKANGNVFLSAIPTVSDDYTITSNVIEANNGILSNPDNESKIYINELNNVDNIIQIFGGVKVEGASRGNEIVVNFANDNSFWYGNASSSTYTKNLTIGLSNGAKWVPVDYDSNRKVTDVVNGSVGTLNLNEGGIVDISKYNMDDAPEEAIVEGVATGADRTAATNHKVSVTNLNGSNGIFRMDLQHISNDVSDYSGYSNKNSDWLDIENGNGGTQYIDFNAKDANIDKMNVGDKIYFANVATGDTQFDSTQHVYSSAANVNNYEYGVESETGSGTDWYVTLNNKTTDGNGNFEAAKGAMYAGYALGTELDRLNKRMGEARYLEDEKGVWVRYRHAKTGWDDTFETSSDMFQLGYDKEVQEDDGKHYRGIALDYTDADTTLDNVSGDGEHERYAVSLYDTWLGEKGHYRDLVIRGGRINSDYDLHGMFNDGMYDIGGDYHQWFGSISAEWGRKNDMNDGWYFEPQTQLQLARVGGASYVSDSGITVDQDGAPSLIGRVGFRLGREYAKADGTKHDNYYIKADLLHEFMGDKGIALTGADGRYEHEYDGQETWFDVGLGADISIDKDTYFWVDVEKTLGSDFDNTWQVNGGFRWEF